MENPFGEAIAVVVVSNLRFGHLQAQYVHTTHYPGAILIGGVQLKFAPPHVDF